MQRRNDVRRREVYNGRCFLPIHQARGSLTVMLVCLDREDRHGPVGDIEHPTQKFHQVHTAVIDKREYDVLSQASLLHYRTRSSHLTSYDTTSALAGVQADRH